MRSIRSVRASRGDGRADNLSLFSGIDILSEVAVFKQIKNLVQFATASGRLKADDALPTVRELSERLEVNANTVAKAYRDLEVMGLVYTRRGIGVFIDKGAESRCRELCRKRISGRLREVAAEARTAGISFKAVSAIASASYASDSGPYGPVPASVLAAGKDAK